MTSSCCNQKTRLVNIIYSHVKHKNKNSNYVFISIRLIFFQDINLIKNVQQNFTRCVCLICHLPLVSYEERLSMFKLERLELHHLHIDLTNLFRIVQHITACNIYNVLLCWHFMCLNVNVFMPI